MIYFLIQYTKQTFFWGVGDLLTHLKTEVTTKSVKKVVISLHISNFGYTVKICHGSIHLYKKNGCISVNVHVGKITTRTQVFWSRKSWRGSCGERIILRCFWCSRIVLLSFLGLKPRCSNVITLGFLVCFLFKFPLTLLSGFLFSGGATCSVSG